MLTSQTWPHGPAAPRGHTFAPAAGVRPGAARHASGTPISAPGWNVGSMDILASGDREPFREVLRPVLPVSARIRATAPAPAAAQRDSVGEEAGPAPAPAPSPAAPAAAGATREYTGPTEPGTAPGREPAPGMPGAPPPVPAGPVREPREGETIRLPDVPPDPARDVPQSDAVASTLTYNGTITQGGAAPSPFGETRPYTHALSGIAVTRTGTTYTVTATVDNPITFQVNGGGKTDIDSATDADITRANYAGVATDLTPDMSDLNGRPPRNHFWARDLCIRHERFHATEDVTYGRAGTALAQTWLNAQTAASVAEVQALVAQVPGKVANHVDTNMAFPGRENRAYGDGAPAYTARANAITTRGTAGQYP